MNQRRAARVLARRQHNLDQVRNAPTQKSRLRKACMALVAEAVRGGHAHLIDLITNAVLDLMFRVQEGIPLPDPARGAPTVDNLNHSTWRDDVA